jgi:hypothetical protein
MELQSLSHFVALVSPFIGDACSSFLVARTSSATLHMTSDADDIVLVCEQHQLAQRSADAPMMHPLLRIVIQHARCLMMKQAFDMSFVHLVANL